MTFTPAELIKLKRFCQEIISSPRPLDDQPSQKSGIYLWCEDWEIIEILKYFFLGREVYYLDPPPNRLKNNPLFSKDEIEKKAGGFMHQSADEVIEKLKNKRCVKC